jgi:hypothetical protein
MLKTIAKILFISSSALSASPPSDRVARLRAFAESVKAIIPADRPLLTRDSSVATEAILEKALQFVDHKGSDFVQGLEIMSLVCSSGIGKEDVDNVMWRAIGILCSGEPRMVAGGSPDVELNAAFRPIETTTDDPSETETSSESDSDGGACKKQKVVLTDSSNLYDPEHSTMTVSDKLKVRLRVVRMVAEDRRGAGKYFSSSPGMRFLANKFLRMAKKGESDLLLSNFKLLETARVPPENIAFMFQGVYEVLIDGRDTEESPLIDFATARTGKRFSMDRFRSLVVDRYCRDPRFRIEIPRELQAFSKNLLNKVREGKYESVDRTVEFLELAGLDFRQLGYILSPLCHHLTSRRD